MSTSTASCPQCVCSADETLAPHSKVSQDGSSFKGSSQLRDDYTYWDDWHTFPQMTYNTSTHSTSQPESVAASSCTRYTIACEVTSCGCLPDWFGCCACICLNISQWQGSFPKDSRRDKPCLPSRPKCSLTEFLNKRSFPSKLADILQIPTCTALHTAHIYLVGIVLWCPHLCSHPQTTHKTKCRAGILRFPVSGH